MARTSSEHHRQRISLISLADIVAAKDRVYRLAHRTRAFETIAFQDHIGTELYIKPEIFQPIGVFKIRGASNKLLRLSEEERRRGVITASSGNHGQAVAYVASKLGISATVCVPTGANPDKLAAIRRFGASVVEGGRTYDEAYVRALKLKRQMGAVLVHPFDDPDVIAGQGTIGIEIVEDVPQVDTVVVPVGGGGLISGVASAVKALKPDVKIVGVQSRGAPSMYKSLAKGKLTNADVNTLADGLAAERPGELTFSITKKLVAKIVLVEDNELLEAMAMIMERLHVLTELAGAAAIAALLYHYKPKLKESVVAVLSGANATRKMVSRALAVG